MGTKAAMALGADVIERHFTIEGADDAHDGCIHNASPHAGAINFLLFLQERKMYG